MQKARDQDVERLNSLLLEELSAVTSYTRCIETVEDQHLLAPLRALRSSHEERVHWLSDRIDSQGGTPVRHARPGSAWARAIAAGVHPLGDAQTMAVLEHGEARGQEHYHRNLSRLSRDTKEFVTRRVLPEQRFTWASAREIRRLQR